MTQVVPQTPDPKRRDQRVLLINIELHDRQGHELYAVCVPNDVITLKSQPWQLAALMTAANIVNLLGVNVECLPRGVRAVSPKFEPFRRVKVCI